MEIRRLSGGKTFEVKQVESPLPEGIESAAGRVGHPGTLKGNVALARAIAEAAKLKCGVPSVALVRIVFRQYDAGTYLFIGPKTEAGPNTYKLTLRKGAPVVTGLAKLFKESEVPLREDQWYWLKSEVVEDDQEGFGVACDWTKARLEPRDIGKERRQRSEAQKRRRAKRKQDGGGQGNASEPAGA